MATCNHTDEEIRDFIIEHPELPHEETRVILGCGNQRLSRIRLALFAADPGVLLAATRARRGLQKKTDLLRVERKISREALRVDNTLVELTAEMTKLLAQVNLKGFTRKHPAGKSAKAAGIIQLSDLHFNELVDVHGNRYDFTVASQRLKLHADQAIRYFKAFGITNVLIANTGDILNSDRRLDELMSMATNRTKAMLLAVVLLQQFILYLNQHFNITYVGVSGNESRMHKEHGNSKNILSDNYDYAIHNMLAMLFKGSKGVMFKDGDPAECLVTVAGQNVLLMHGEMVQQGGVERAVTQIKGKYADLGITIQYILFGDKHYSRVGDTFSRGSSLVGANAYSFTGLQLSSRAAQNLFIFYENGNRDGIKVDLQRVNDIKGFDITEALEAYNPKSERKLHTPQTIVEVVI